MKPEHALIAFRDAHPSWKAPEVTPYLTVRTDEESGWNYIYFQGQQLGYVRLEGNKIYAVLGSNERDTERAESEEWARQAVEELQQSGSEEEE